MSTQELLNEIRILTQRNITIKEELAFYQEQERLNNFFTLKNLLNELQNNTFLDNFNDTTMKITISDNYLNGTERSFLVDTLSPEFLTALTNELKNSLLKKSIQLNDLLLQTATYEPISNDDEEWLNDFTYQPSNIIQNPIKIVKENYVFKVGDKVKVTSCGKQYVRTEKYYNNWVSDMNSMVNDGINYTITSISKVGIQLNNNYYFPTQSLTHVERAEEEYLKEE
jgi:hypothetical protein